MHFWLQRSLIRANEQQRRVVASVVLVVGNCCHLFDLKYRLCNHYGTGKGGEKQMVVVLIIEEKLIYRNCDDDNDNNKSASRVASAVARKQH